MPLSHGVYTSKERGHYLSPFFPHGSLIVVCFGNNKEDLEIAGIFIWLSLLCDPWVQSRDILVPGSIARFQKDLNFQPPISLSSNLWKFTLGYVLRTWDPNPTDFSMFWMKPFVDSSHSCPGWGRFLYFCFIDWAQKHGECNGKKAP